MRHSPSLGHRTICGHHVNGYLSPPTDRDPLSSEEEERLVILGRSGLQHTLVVVHTYRGEVIRIISARPATSSESRDYERGKE